MFISLPLALYALICHHNVALLPLSGWGVTQIPCRSIKYLNNNGSLIEGERICSKFMHLEKLCAPAAEKQMSHKQTNIFKTSHIFLP